MSFYYGGRRRAPVQRDYKKEIPRLSKITGLDLKDLKKIRLYLTTYPEKVAAISAENKRIREANEQTSRMNAQVSEKWEKDKEAQDARYNRENIAPIEVRINSLRDELSRHEISTFTALLSSDVITSYALGRTAKFKGTRAADIIRELELCFDKRSALERSRNSTPPPNRRETISLKNQANEYTVLTISGAKVRVFYSDFTIAAIDVLIAECEARVEKEKEKIREIKARADREELTVRSQAKQYSRELSSQLLKYTGCPYCSGTLNASNYHQDHIHPVSKGGLSTRGNLVFVCSRCNLKKGGKTLRVFLRDEGISFDVVSDRLDLLGKH